MDGNIQTKPFRGERIVARTDRSFDAVLHSLREVLGKTTVADVNALAKGAISESEFSRCVEERYVGISGFMLFAEIDHSAWLPVYGITQKAVRWILGNPLYAITMIRHDITAGLFVPVEVLIAEEIDGVGATVTYVRPSSLIAIDDNRPLLDAAQALDAKLAALVVGATHSTHWESKVRGLHFQSRSSTMTNSDKIVVAGATGQLGRLVVAELLQIAPSARVIGLVRNVAAAKELVHSSIDLRRADYDDPASIAAALAGADKLLMISSSELGQRRVAQHRKVIDAAMAAGLELLVYTSLLHADTSPMGLAEGHRETEALIQASGVPFVLLRNGWYTENYAANAPTAVKDGTVLGAAGDGRISSAARADFAAAAAAVLANPDNPAGEIYELAGDTSYTLAELAAEISRQSGSQVAYHDLTEAAYKAALQSTGLADAFAQIYAESDAKAAHGSLFDESRQLSHLIGRPTTTMAQSVAAALAATSSPQ